MKNWSKSEGGPVGPVVYKLLKSLGGRWSGPVGPVVYKSLILLRGRWGPVHSPYYVGGPLAGGPPYVRETKIRRPRNG